VSLQLRWFSGRSVVPCPSLTAHPAARDREYKLAELCPCFVKLKSLHVLEWRHPAEHGEALACATIPYCDDASSRIGSRSNRLVRGKADKQACTHKSCN